MISERRFGLEIECGISGNENAVMRRLQDEVGGEWDLDYDGTEFEIRTPIFQGEEGFSRLERTYAIINDGGGFTTDMDGGHVHLEALDYTSYGMLARLVRSWINLEPAIEGIVAPYRRGSYAACPKVWNKDRAKATYIQRNFTGRGNLNINNIRSRISNGASSVDEYGYCDGCGERPTYCWCDTSPPTVEVRLHEGSLNYEHMAAWIQMCQGLLDKVAVEGITLRSCNRPATLINRLGLSPEVGEVLVQKAKTVTNPPSPDSGPEYCSCGCQDSSW